MNNELIEILIKFGMDKTLAQCLRNLKCDGLKEFLEVPNKDILGLPGIGAKKLDRINTIRGVIRGQSESAPITSLNLGIARAVANHQLSISDQIFNERQIIEKFSFRFCNDDGIKPHIMKQLILPNGIYCDFTVRPFKILSTLREDKIRGTLYLVSTLDFYDRGYPFLIPYAEGSSFFFEKTTLPLNNFINWVEPHVVHTGDFRYYLRECEILINEGGAAFFPLKLRGRTNLIVWKEGMGVDGKAMVSFVEIVAKFNQALLIKRFSIKPPKK